MHKYSLCYVGHLTMKKGKSWHCATAKAFVCYQHVFSHKSKTAHKLPWRKITPSHPDPRQVLDQAHHYYIMKLIAWHRARALLTLYFCVCVFVLFVYVCDSIPSCLHTFLGLSAFLVFASYLEWQFFCLIHKRGKKISKNTVVTKIKDCLGRKV